MRAARGIVAAVAAASACLSLALPGTAPAARAAVDEGDRTVRVFAVAYRQDLARVESYASFRESIRTRFEAEVQPHLQGDGLDLVTYPENVSLLAYLVGARGLASRQALALAGGEANSGAGALASLAGLYAPQMAYYEAKFPGVDAPGQLLQLALTDTLARVVVETFSELARDHGVWVAASSNLAPFEVVTGPSAALLGDPEAGTAYAYEAVEPDVRNRNFLFGPDGEVVDVQDKAYLVPIERERGLGLGLYGVEVTDLPVADLPIGRVATVISKDAWMPDVNERLDQLRAQVLVQSEAFSTWGTTAGDLWPPDKFQRGGWWMVQKHPSFAVNATPQLTGNLGDLTFDGQPIVAVPGPAGDPSLCLSGQLPEVGWAAVGPWVAGPAADLCDPSLRPDLSQAAADLSPGSGSPEENAYTESTVWADVLVPVDVVRGGRFPASGTGSVAVDPGPGVQVHPSVAHDAGTTHLAWIAGGPDATTFARATVTDGVVGDVFASPTAASRYDHFDNEWDPLVLVGPDGPVVVHTAFPTENWDLFATFPGGERVRIDDAGTEGGVLRERGHSDQAGLVLPDGTMVVAWSDLRWPWIKPQVRVATSADGGRSWSASARVDGGPLAFEDEQLDGRDPGESRGQAFPAIVADGSDLVVVWQEHDAFGLPAIWSSRSADGGTSWTGPVRVSPPGVDARRPALAATSAGLAVGWEEPHVAGGRVVVGRLAADGGLVGSADAVALGGAGQRYLSLVDLPEGAVAAVFEDRRSGDADVLVSWLSADSLALLGTQRADDGPGGTDARVPVVVADEDGRLVVAWQDTREGVENLRIATVAPPGLPEPAPLPVTGGGAATMAALAAVAGLRLGRRA